MKKLARATNNIDSEGAALDLLTAGWNGLLGGHGRSLLESALPSWLPRQRWFGAKSRRIQSARVLQWAELPSASAMTADFTAAHAAASTLPSALFFVEIAYLDCNPDVYQIPLAISTGTDADEITASRPETILTTFSSTSGPAVLHDATARADFRQSLLTLIERSSTVALAKPRTTAPAPLKGRLAARASSAFMGSPNLPRLTSRVGSAEQSNTSILYGKQLILKLFRRLQPGENPDVEIGRFLTEVAHFPRVAPFLGEISIAAADGEKTTVAMLQQLVENQGDGWQWFLDQLASFFQRVEVLPAPPASRAPSFGNPGDAPRQRPEAAGPSLEAAALLGLRTAELHLVLSTSSISPAFAPEPITLEHLDQDARRIQAQLTSTLAALKGKLPTLDDVTSDAAGLLLSRRLELVACSRAITSSAAAGQRIRIHGDYHLGQTLRIAKASTGPRAVPDTRPASQTGDFVLLDFEGEPARSLADRRRKQSPLKDVAGMLRSFSYVAHTALDQFLAAKGERAHGSGADRIAANLAAWALRWQNFASAEFLRAYRKTIAANPALLPPTQQSQTLLNAYLLEKALYELLYELNNRPQWLPIPIDGILSLHTQPAREQPARDFRAA